MSKPRFKRQLGLLQATMMGVGGAICAGVFVTLGYAASLAGTALIVAVVLCGVINFLTMLSYAELGAALPSAGGEYTFAKAALGGFLSFTTGWFEWISNMFYAAFSAVGFAYLLSYIFPAINIPLMAVLVIAAFTLINVKGVKETGTVQTGLVMVLLGLLVLFVVWGFMASPTADIGLSAPQGPLGVLRASAFIFVVYLGGEAIAVAQAEIKEPGKTIPRAILLTCLILIVVYTLVTAVVLRVVTPEALSDKVSPLAYVAQQFMGNIGVAVITSAGVIAALSSVNTSIMAQSRVAYALARDGYFPKILHRLHNSFCTPHVAILIGSIFVAAVAAMGVVNFVTYATDFGFIIGFILVNLSLIRLRQNKPSIVRPFKVPLYPLTPLLGIATSLLLLSFLEPATLVMGIELFLFGLLAYYVRMVGRKRLCLALSGMNFGFGILSAMIAYGIATQSIEAELWTSVFAGVASLACFGAGILCAFKHSYGDDEFAGR